MNPILFVGMEDIIEGLVVPVVISLVVSVVRVALWGWTGIGNVAANVCVSCFGGICAHWILSSLGCPPTVSAAITSLVGLFSRELLQAVFSPRTLAIIRKRVEHEILYRGRGRE